MINKRNQRRFKRSLKASRHKISLRQRMQKHSIDSKLPYLIKLLYKAFPGFTNINQNDRLAFIDAIAGDLNSVILENKRNERNKRKEELTDEEATDKNDQKEI